MARQMLNHFTYGYDPTVEQFRHSARLGHHMHMDRSFARHNPRTDPMAGRQVSQQSSNNTHHPTTLQSTNGGPPRRRIPCGRCRKRKIRCSGDPGDNTGCANCKSAGITNGQCIFLRVSSSNIELSPYSTSSASTSATSSFSFGMPHASLSTSALHSTLSSQPSIRLGNHGIGGISDSASLKSLYSLDAMVGAEASNILLATRTPYDNLSNEMGTTGGVSGSAESSYSQYMLPPTDSSHGIGEPSSSQTILGHGSPEFIRPWPPLASNSRSSAPSSGFYVDQEVTQNMNSVGHAMPTYVSSNIRINHSSNSIDSYPIAFPTLNSVSSSLPEGISRTSLPEKSLPPLPPFPVRIQANDFKEPGPLSAATDGISPQSAYVPASLSPSATSRNSSNLSSASSSYVSNPSTIQLSSASAPSLTSASVGNSNAPYMISGIGVGSSSHSQLNSSLDPLGHHNSNMHSSKHEDSDNISTSHKIGGPTSFCTTSASNSYSSGNQRRGSTLSKVY